MPPPGPVIPTKLHAGRCTAHPGFQQPSSFSKPDKWTGRRVTNKYHQLTHPLQIYMKIHHKTLMRLRRHKLQGGGCRAIVAGLIDGSDLWVMTAASSKTVVNSWPALLGDLTSPIACFSPPHQPPNVQLQPLHGPIFPNWWGAPATQPECSSHSQTCCFIPGPLTSRMNVYESNSLSVNSRESHILLPHEGKRLQIMVLTFRQNWSSWVSCNSAHTAVKACSIHTGMWKPAGALSPKADQMNQIH